MRRLQSGSSSSAHFHNHVSIYFFTIIIIAFSMRLISSDVVVQIQTQLPSQSLHSVRVLSTNCPVPAAAVRLGASLSYQSSAVDCPFDRVQSLLDSQYFYKK